MGPLPANKLSDTVLTWSALVLMSLGATIFIVLAVLPKHLQLKLGIKHLRTRRGAEPAHTPTGRIGLFMIGGFMLGAAVWILYIMTRS